MNTKINTVAYGMNEGTTNTKVTLTESDLTATAKSIKDAADTIKTELDRVKNSMSGVSGVWKDSNATTYMNKFYDLSTNFEKFYQEVYSFGTFLDAVVAAYEKEYNSAAQTAVNNQE